MKPSFQSKLRLILLLGIIYTISVTSYAQQNSLLVFGNIYYVKYGGTSDQRLYNFHLGAGYQMNPYWTAGLEFGYGNTKVGNGSARSNFDVGPFIRAEMPINEMFSTYVQIGGGYSRLDYANLNGFYLELFPAIKWTIHKGFALNLSTGLIRYTKTGDSNEFDFNYGIVPSIGVSYNFSFRSHTDEKGAQ